MSTYLRKRHRTPHPAANIFRRNDKDVTDSVFADTPAVDSGVTAAQLFTGRHSKFVSVHGIKDTSEDEILGAFQDRVCWHGAPQELGADNAVVYRGKKFVAYCRDLYIYSSLAI